MKYFLFLDESGDHDLSSPSPDFPVFLLCGVLISSVNYEIIHGSMNTLKQSIWADKQVIFRSRDIRKCKKEFQVLLNLDMKRRFYEGINEIAIESNYHILAWAVRKYPIIENYQQPPADIYEISFISIIERAIMILTQIHAATELCIVIEHRGRKEDKQLTTHFHRLCNRGTTTLSRQQIHEVTPTFAFRNRTENINGLQLADLFAYPIARHVIEPNCVNPAYEILAPKIFRSGDLMEGLAI